MASECACLVADAGKNGVTPPRIYSVSELAFELKSQLESRFASCGVRGEVSGAKKVGSGHIYFTLKDKDAQINCAWFSGMRLAAGRIPSCNTMISSSRQ